jgi:methylthioribose-1-phosphate isomerase
MRVNGTPYRTVWMDGGTVHLIDQNRLPFAFELVGCADHRATADAIRDMTVRGAPAIGAAAAYALAQAFGEADARDPWPYARAARGLIEATRPTARDLFHGTEHVWIAARAAHPADTARAAREAAQALADESVEGCRRIGQHGAALVPEGARVLTHCNAGWLATVDYGTARLRGRGRGARRAGVGGRDAPPRAGRPPDRVGAGERGYPAFRHRGQRRRLPDEPRRGGPGDRGR